MANTVEKGLVSKSALTAIGDAIRAKNGSTTKYKPSEMATAISGLEGKQEVASITFDSDDNSHYSYLGFSSEYGYVDIIASSQADTMFVKPIGQPQNGYMPGEITMNRNVQNNTITIHFGSCSPTSAPPDGYATYQQESIMDNTFYPYPPQEESEICTSNTLPGKVCIADMDYPIIESKNYANHGVTYPNQSRKLTDYYNSFLMTTPFSLLSGEESALKSVRLPNLVSCYQILGNDSAVKHLELPILQNIDKVGGNLMSFEAPNLLGDFNFRWIDTLKFIDVGYADCYAALHTLTLSGAVVVARSTSCTNASFASTPSNTLFIVPSSVVDTFRKIIPASNYVTALEKSPFADSKTVCGNNMEVEYYDPINGKPTLTGFGTVLFYSARRDSWQYVSDTDQLPTASEITPGTGFYFSSKLTKEKGYTIPT